MPLAFPAAMSLAAGPEVFLRGRIAHTFSSRNGSLGFCAQHVRRGAAPQSRASSQRSTPRFQRFSGERRRLTVRRVVAPSPSEATPADREDASASASASSECDEFSLRAEEIAHLRPLRDGLFDAGSDLKKKTAIIDADGPVSRVLSNIATEDAFLLKCVVAIGQSHVLKVDDEDPVHLVNSLGSLLKTLRNVDVFYDMIGGLVGYQLAALELIHEQLGGPPPSPMVARGEHDVSDSSERVLQDEGEMNLHVPVGPDLRDDGGAYAARAAAWGIEALPNMAEVYPLGGAGDRLGLVDEVTGESLPAALLMYNGRTLIEGLLRDLAAREWLYYKLHGVQHTTPVAIMTSAAKGNHRRISSLMNDKGWFGRGKEGFRLFEQPLVPVVTTRGGRWVEEGELEIALKPGGHGAIWKLMHDKGVFRWLATKGRKGGIVRQITNPMAGTDTTLLALSGVGVKENKAMGFACCERHLGAAEGVNVLVEKRESGSDTWSYGISNVEYTVLEQYGISDEPVAPGSSESAFPANTNVLYIGLEKLRAALLSSPKGAFPGMLVNLSKPVTSDGTKGGRLETSMQNIADVLMLDSPGSKLGPSEYENLPTFMLHTLRRRITSSAKKKRDPTKVNLAQTPDGSFLDLLRNASDLLDRCGVDHPEPEGGTVEEYLERGPGFIFCSHPAIGPLWDVTEQKLRGGSLGPRSEVRLEVAELEWVDVQVYGSLIVEATAPLGGDPALAASTAAPLEFNDAGCGRLRLRDVVVANRGVDWSVPGTTAWCARITRTERCEIILHGDAEFDAKGVTIEGDVVYEVPAGMRLELRDDGDGGVKETWTKLQGPSWRWRYEMGADSRVRCSIVEAAERKDGADLDNTLDQSTGAVSSGKRHPAPPSMRSKKSSSGERRMAR